MAKRGEARDQLVKTALRLFYAHGLRAVGVDTIIAESGVAKATFYKHFPGKDDLVLAYLDEVDVVWKAQLREAAEAAGPDPAKQLVGMFDALEAACLREGYRGCAFVNAAAESPAGTPVHERTVRHKREVREWVEGMAAAAGAREPAALARSLTVMIDGVLADGVLEAFPTTARVARTAASALVAASVSTGVAGTAAAGTAGASA